MPEPRNIHPVTFSDQLWQLSRLIFLFVLVSLAHPFVSEYYTEELQQPSLYLVATVKVHTFSALIGGICYILAMQSFFFLMQVFLGCEILGLQDQTFLHDTEHNNHIMSCAAVFDKWDNYADVRLGMMQKSKEINKSQTKLVKHFGMYWQQQMTKEEWNEELPNIWNTVEGVNDKDQLRDFVLNLCTYNDMGVGKPQQKFYLIPNFGKNESVFIFRTHHSQMDGLGLATLMQCYNGKYDSSHLPRMKPISPLFWAFTILVSPFLFAWINPTFFMLPFEKNSLKKDEPIQGKKKLGIAFNMHLAEMKKYCKERKVTINDYCSGLLTCCLKEHFDMEEQKQRKSGQKVYPTPDSIRLATPFSFRQPAKKIQDVKLQNNFGTIFFDFKLRENFEECLLNCHKEFSWMKSSLKPFGNLFTTMAASMFPLGLDKFSMDFQYEKFSGILSNLVSSTEPYEVGGKKSKYHFTCYCGLSKIYTTFMFNTVGPRMTFSVGSDQVMMEDPQLFCDMLQKKNEEILGLKSQQ